MVVHIPIVVDIPAECVEIPAEVVDILAKGVDILAEAVDILVEVVDILSEVPDILAEVEDNLPDLLDTAEVPDHILILVSELHGPCLPCPPFFPCMSLQPPGPAQQSAQFSPYLAAS